MNSKENLNSYLSSIDSFLEDIKILYNPAHKDSISDHPYEAKNSYSELKHQLGIYEKFLSPETIKLLNEKLSLISTNLSKLADNNFNNEVEHSNIVVNTINMMKDLPDLRSQRLYFNSEISLAELSKLIPDIGFKLIMVDELNIENNLNKIPDEDKEQATKLLIDLHNTLYSRNIPEPNIMHACYQFFDKLRNKIELSDIQEEISEAKDILTHVKTETGDISNKDLGNAFQVEGERHKWTIRIYTALIFLSFTSLILSLLYFISKSKTPTGYVFPNDIHFYYFYISLILMITGFLTFIIKERTRLVNHSQYCAISHLEILALSSYCAEIRDTNKVNDLKIHLADRYFKGPNPSSESSPNEYNVSILSSKLSEISKAIQDFKSTIK